MKRKLETYSETLYHLINFRIEQFKQSKTIIGIDYIAFMILSVIGGHVLKHNFLGVNDWDSVWAQTRTKKNEDFLIKKKLTIFAVASILNLPKETVRRKIELLKKKKFINHTSKLGLLPTDKIEILMKPFSINEVNSLSAFLNALKKNKALDQILQIND